MSRAIDSFENNTVLARRELLPLPFLLAELWGATHSPFAFLATFREDRKRRGLYSTAPRRKT
jgi:hypothetical protein